MKYDIYNLVIELGRQCNLNCPHCLRGKSQDVKINTKYIDDILDKTEHITDLTLTGGEPFLYPDIIRHIVNKIKANNISIDCFYIATNGLVKNYDILHDIIDLYDIAYEKELCGLKISRDQYHDNNNYWNALDAFKFTMSNSYDLEEKYLIKQGNAVLNYADATRYASDNIPEIEYHENTCYITEGLIYLNANGDILTGCDYSYENQEYNSHGNLDDKDFDDIITGLADDI